MFAVIEFVWTIFTTLLGLALVLSVPVAVWALFKAEVESFERSARRKRK